MTIGTDKKLISDGYLNSLPVPVLQPDLCLAVGITGHRMKWLQNADLIALNRVVSHLLSEVKTASAAIATKHPSQFASTIPNLRLVSALADGADSIAAEAALAAGWRLDACLPFPHDDYANDFTEGEHRQHFSQLAARAAATFTLCGNRQDADAAYEAVGHLMLEQVDVLIAIWDGDVGRGRGGTARIVAEAISRHIPVIHIDSNSGLDASNETTLLWSGLAEFEIEQPTIDNVPRVVTSKALALVISTLCAPPENPIDQRMLEKFYVKPVRAPFPAIPYPLLLAITGVRGFRWSQLAPAAAATCAEPLAAQLARITAGNVAQDAGSDLASKVSSNDSSAAANEHKHEHERYQAALNTKLITRFGLADSAAAYFAQVFRSGFVANFGLAAIAVLIALTGPLAPSYKLWLIITELGVIGIIFFNTRAGIKAGWHECWMDDRHLAEQLRSLAMTSALGNLNLRANVGNSAGADNILPGWVHWLARATARELGMPNAIADKGYLTRVHSAALSLVEDQLAYHRLNAKRMHKLESRLHHTGEYLFGGTIIACSVWIVCKLAGVPMSFGGTIGMTEIVTALTAAMPAVGAAIYGIRMQGDFAGVADRSEATVARLLRLHRALKDDPLDYTRLIARLKRLSEIMLTDVEHWRTTYQAKPLTLPG